MNYMYSPVLAGTQVPFQPTFVPQGAIGTQLGQLAGGILPAFLPGPFGALASQLLPQLGNLLPFQAGPQAQFLPHAMIGNPLGHLAAGIAGQILPGPYGGIGNQPYGGIGNQWVPQAGNVIPFQSSPQVPFAHGPMGNPWGQPYGGIGNQWTPYAGNVTPFQGGPQTVLLPQGVLGGQLGQLAGGILGHFLPGPFGAIASQLMPQIGSVLLPFQAGPQQPVPIAGYGGLNPFVTVGVQW